MGYLHSADEMRWHDKRQHRAEAAKQEVTRQLARDSERQMGGRRRRLTLKRQQRIENSVA
jgi:hypothetical protein